MPKNKPSTRPKPAKKKRLKREIASLDEADRSVLLELRPKQVRHLVRAVEQESPEFDSKRWKAKRKCCGKRLHKMCSRCPRRMLVQVARDDAGLLERLT